MSYAITGDAIVNAANSSLLGGGGVDGAIHRAAGGMIPVGNFDDAPVVELFVGALNTDRLFEPVTCGPNLRMAFIPEWQEGQSVLTLISRLCDERSGG